MIIGDAYEDARLALKNPAGVNVTKKAPASKFKKPVSRSAKRRRGDDDDGDDDADDKQRKKGNPASGRSNKTMGGEEEEEEEAEAEEDEEDKKVPSLLLATSWKVEGGQDVTGWLMSEKLDGVR